MILKVVVFFILVGLLAACAPTATPTSERIIETVVVVETIEITSEPVVQEKIVEYAYGVIKPKSGKVGYINFLTQITPDCDCPSWSDAPIVPDIGIVSSLDPVAIDQASADLVNQAQGRRDSSLTKNFQSGKDKFRALYPNVDWEIQLNYAQQIGLGSRDYELKVI